MKGLRPPFHSIILDNDISFTQHEKIADAFNSKTYFCDAYKSYQKGSIENGNRLLREYFPRRMDILEVTQIEIDKHVELINNRPMKCLGYKTPNEIYNQHVAKLLKVINF
jgi:IS30 family transposase